MIPDPAPPFEFEPSGAMKERMRQLIERAIQVGARDQTVRSLREIVRLLIQSPRTWGDPIRHYRHAQPTEYRGSHQNFRCIYTVHDRIPIVFLTRITPLPGNPLYGTGPDG